MRYSALSGGFRVWIVNEAQAMTARAVQAWLTALDRINARARFKVACRVLGPERIRELTIHHGRHSFISHALAGGRTLAEVRAITSAGHPGEPRLARRLRVAGAATVVVKLHIRPFWSHIFLAVPEGSGAADVGPSTAKGPAG